jgi:hypothetical protein
MWAPNDIRPLVLLHWNLLKVAAETDVDFSIVRAAAPPDASAGGLPSRQPKPASRKGEPPCNTDSSISL